MRKRPRNVAGNPFVVFADLTTALAFIFLLCSIALSKGLADFDRRDQQKAFLDKIVQIFSTDEKGKSIPVDTDSNFVEKESDRMLNEVVRKKDAPREEILVKVQTNVALQRITIGNMYRFGEIEPLPQFRDALKRLATTTKELVAGDKGSPYVYFQGIAEIGEAEAYSQDHKSDQLTRKTLAYRRAQRIYDLFKTDGAIAETTSEAQSNQMIDPDYAIVIEKSELYSGNLGHDTNPNRIPGRVDISVFLPDR